jgi:phage terminase large subunit-like protein
VKMVVVENNQGGDLWVDVLDDLPVRLKTYAAREGKEVKFARALDVQQRYRVTFSRPIPALEDQCLAWPRVPHDDVMDAVMSGALRLLTPRLARKDGTLTPR